MDSTGHHLAEGMKALANMGANGFCMTLRLCLAMLLPFLVGAWFVISKGVETVWQNWLCGIILGVAAVQIPVHLLPASGMFRAWLFIIAFTGCLFLPMALAWVLSPTEGAFKGLMTTIYVIVGSLLIWGFAS